MRAKEFGTNPKRPGRAGSRPERGHKPLERYKTKETDVDEVQDTELRVSHQNAQQHYAGLNHQQAFEKWVQRSLVHSREDDEQLKQRVADLEDKVQQLGHGTVAEAQSLGGALTNALSKVEPGSKLDKKIKHHNDMVRRFGAESGTMKSAPDGYHIDKKGHIRLGSGKVSEVVVNPNRVIDASGHSAANPYSNVDSMGNPIKSPINRDNVDMDKVTARAKEMFKQGMSEQQVREALIKQGVPARLADQAVQAGQMEGIGDWLAEHGKASRRLCLSGIPDDDLGASQLASCKSQGLRARDGEKSHLIGHGSAKARIKVGGKKIKGKKYGGPLPDYGTRKGQR